MRRLTRTAVAMVTTVVLTSGCSPLNYAKSDEDLARVELFKSESIFRFNPDGAAERSPIGVRWGGEPPQLVESHELNKQFIVDDGASEAVARQYLDEALASGWVEIEVRCDRAGYSVTGLKLVDGVRASFQIRVQPDALAEQAAPLAFLSGFIGTVERFTDRPPGPDPDPNAEPILDCLTPTN
jgi:hypothetical protein